MPPRKLPPNEQLVEMYDSGMSCGEIAEKFGVATVTVSSQLWRMGHPMRDAKEAARLAVERGRNKPTRYWEGKRQPAEMVERRVSKIRGDKHWLWKGGESRRPYRNVIDKTVCDACGATDNLGIHHVNLDHYDNDPGNLRVLCVNCHMSIHKQAYWDAIHAGEQPVKSNGQVGWKKKGGATNGL